MSRHSILLLYSGGIRIKKNIYKYIKEEQNTYNKIWNIDST